MCVLSPLSVIVVSVAHGLTICVPFRKKTLQQLCVFSKNPKSKVHTLKGLYIRKKTQGCHCRRRMSAAIKAAVEPRLWSILKLEPQALNTVATDTTPPPSQKEDITTVLATLADYTVPMIQIVTQLCLPCALYFMHVILRPSSLRTLPYALYLGKQRTKPTSVESNLFTMNAPARD